MSASKLHPGQRGKQIQPLFGPKNTEAIIKMVRKGAPISMACWSVGINPVTHYRWIHKAQQGRPEYVDYMHRVRKAQADWAMSKLEELDGAKESKELWQNKAWQLERLMPQHFAMRKMEGAPAEEVAIGAIPIILQTLGHEVVQALIEEQLESKPLALPSGDKDKKDEE